jgi:processive 1,2-diacylglycerol beta-glucosyltransferase
MKSTRGLENFYVHGYVRDLSRLMGASDILITKPGGLSCSEALAKQCPLILTSPIPGQEERNVRFLTKHQVAKLARSPEDLIHTVSDLLRHPKKIQSMRQHAKIISKPHSAWEASRLIFDLINKRGTFAH